MTQNKSNIALLLGDPAGIGPELISKLLNDDMTKKANIVIIGEKQVFENGNNITGISHKLLGGENMFGSENDNKPFNFDSSTWNTVQTVTVTAVNESDNDSDQYFQVILLPAISSDNNYNGLDPQDLGFVNKDDD